MIIDLAKMRAETLALIEGTTPGPWTISRYAETHVSAVSRPVCSAGGYSDNSRRPEDVRDENVANTRLIAAAPTLAADTLRLLDEIERLRGVLGRIACQKRGNELETALAIEYADFQDGYDIMIDEARAALAEGGPDDR